MKVLEGEDAGSQCGALPFIRSAQTMTVPRSAIANRCCYAADYGHESRIGQEPRRGLSQRQRGAGGIAGTEFGLACIVAASVGVLRATSRVTLLAVFRRYDLVARLSGLP